MAKEKMANSTDVQPVEQKQEKPKVLPLTDRERQEMNYIASRMNNGTNPPAPDEILRLSKLRAIDNASKAK